MTDRAPRRSTLQYELAGTGAMRAASPGARAPSTKPKILVVDDDKDIVRLLGAILESGGYYAIAAFDPLQGLVVAQKEQPVLVLTDLKMPAGGGMGLMQRLKDNPKTRHIPVVVVTGSQEGGLDADLISRGVVGFLPKPLDPESVLEAVRLALAERRSV